jgi:hypothetical protein
MKKIKFIVFCLFPFLFQGCEMLQPYPNQSVDIPNPERFFATQQSDEWCWAACNQMLLNSANITVTQNSQAKKRTDIFGGDLSDGAGPDFSQAEQCLGGSYTKSDGQTVTITPVVSYIRDRDGSDPDVIIDHLQNGIPIVMVTTWPSHGRVCVGVDYVESQYGKQITCMRFLDPGHGRYPGIQELYPESMNQFLSKGGIGFMTFDIQ